MMVIPPVIGVILILIGIVLFIIDLSVTNHGLLTAGGIVTLLAGGLALFGAGVPYSGVLLGAVVVAAMLMGVVLFGVLGSLRGLGWVFVHGELWRAELAFAPEETDPRDGEPMIGVGSKVTVVGFGEGGTVQVVSVERDYHNRSLDLKG
jgi:membrane-bound ClpP family serine protease